MNLEAQIKHDIESHELMACYDLHGSLSVIDFVALASADDSNNEPGYSVDNGIATVNVRGFLVPKMKRDRSDWGITGYNHISEYIQRAESDPSVSSIVLDIDSGGGYVAGLDDLTETIYQASKPIEAHASGNMYSAAYWIAASANSVTATKNSGIGSIGVLIQHYEESKALEMHGITPTFIRSGKHKAAINSVEPLTDEQKQRLQDDVDEQASIFFNHVAANRKIDVKTIASWQGDTFNAQTAKDYGLIDKIVKQATSLSTNPTLSSEDTMDLQQALAKINELESTLAQKDSTEKQALEQAKQAQEELNKVKAEARQTQLNELTELGIEMSDDDKAVCLAMSDEAFNVVAKQLKAVQSKEPKVPEHLFIEQAINGVEPILGDSLDAKFERAKQKHEKA